MYSTVYCSTLMSDAVTTKVQTAKQKLQETNIPNQLKYIYYLRITSLALSKVQKIEQSHLITTYQARPYSELIALLTQYNPTWWEQCYINPLGLLDSDDPIIYQLLQPTIELHYLVQLLKITYPQTPNVVFLNSAISPLEKQARFKLIQAVH